MEEYINRDILTINLIKDNIDGLLFKIDPNNFIYELSKEKFNNKLICYLINKGFFINYKDNEYNTNALFYAISNNNYLLISNLINNNIDVNLCDIYNKSPLHYAIMLNNLRIVKLLLKTKKININYISINDYTYLLYSVIMKKNIKVTKLLIKKNIDVNKKIDYSPLYYSIKNNLYNTTFLLLNNKNIKIDNHEIFLLFSDKEIINNISIGLFSKLLKILIEKGFDINYTNIYDQTILHKICETDNYDKVKILLDYGSNVNSLDCMNQTPLFYASNFVNTNIIILLLKYYSNFKIVNSNNKMFLDVFMSSYQIKNPYEYLHLDYFNDISSILNRLKIEQNWINRKKFVIFLNNFNKNTKNILSYRDKVLTCESLYMYICSYL
jgi:ankyrin repeat protein